VISDKWDNNLNSTRLRRLKCWIPKIVVFWISVRNIEDWLCLKPNKNTLRCTQMNLYFLRQGLRSPWLRFGKKANSADRTGGSQPRKRRHSRPKSSLLYCRLQSGRCSRGPISWPNADRESQHFQWPQSHSDARIQKHSAINY